jgi:3-oxoacyl-[acyl-carrier protein] reductase
MLGSTMSRDEPSTVEPMRGRCALVTGAGSAAGIGFATALCLARQGARVAITSTTRRIFDRLAELPGGEIRHAAFVADLTEAQAAERLVREARKALGAIGILVNNAGMTQVGRPDRSSLFHRTGDGEWAHKIEINLNTAFRVTRSVLPAMLRRRYGRIVHIASVTGPLVSNPHSAGYSAAKAAMVGMTRALAMEVADKGITVNAVAPGWIATASSTRQEITAGNHAPAGRPGTAAEVAHVAAFLASEGASYVTGQMIVVDGGNSVQEYKGPPEGYY